MTNIDIVVLSNGKNEEMLKLTSQTIESLLVSEDPKLINFKPLVIESNPTLSPYSYQHSQTIYPKTTFGFHKFLNIGLRETKSELICFCNNDLIFHKGWASAILKAFHQFPDLASVGTFCPDFHHSRLDEIPTEVNFGYKNGVFFTGWCFLVKRSIFKKIGEFDENFNFWYADDDFRLTLQHHQISHALVKSAKVTHLGSKTLHGEKNRNQFKLQYSALAYYKYKWQHHNRLIYQLARVKYYLKLLFRSY